MKKNNPSPWQITRWLLRRCWFCAFFKHVIHDSRTSFMQKARRLLGYEGDDTVQGAFMFDKTVEGANFWNVMNDSFIDWYYGNGKEQ